MQVSKRFLALLEQQLAQFTDRPDLRALVVYVAVAEATGQPSLVPIGHWPQSLALAERSGTNASADAETGRRWLPLKDDALLLGALRVDAAHWPWPEALSERLEATARCLTEALRLDLEQQRLGRELSRRDEQLQLLVHQLRNPLAALRTFGQLLRRRLEGDDRNLSLVDGLLSEQHQLSRYVEAIDHLTEAPALVSSDTAGAQALLPPALNGDPQQTLTQILTPLIERAAATAHLQGRSWQPPPQLPDWQGDGAPIAEIVANLLENAFRYSRSGGAIGLHVQLSSQLRLSIWDSGPAIPEAERSPIFEKGVRGSRGAALEGSGLGLALARDLARSLGGELELVVPASRIDAALPAEGNAFRLSLPATASAAAPSTAGSN
ncbi:MAG: sensor histidine kinase [Cyanobacteria bacterium M_surface_10_m2_179]|nr:sensor histidine kinase [Cyanobacteria bacterium M_surface_10_m2_179]